MFKFTSCNKDCQPSLFLRELSVMGRGIGNLLGEIQQSEFDTSTLSGVCCLLNSFFNTIDDVAEHVHEMEMFFQEVVDRDKRMKGLEQRLAEVLSTARQRGIEQRANL